MRLQLIGASVPLENYHRTTPSDQENRQIFRIGLARNTVNRQHPIDLQDGELVEFQFEKGVVWIAEPQQIPALFGQQYRSTDAAITIPTSVQLREKSDAKTRGLFDRIALEFVRIFAPKITEPVISKAVAAIEQRILPQEGLNLVSANFDLLPYSAYRQQLDVTQPILLFLHGTISSTQGSFGDLQTSKTWVALQRKYGDNILAYDHKTLSKSPYENAIDLLKLLPDAEFHLVSHSRGGLIGEILVRCSQTGTAFSSAEIKQLEDENKAILTKFIEVVKQLPTEAANSIFSQTGLENFTHETIKNWRKIDLKTAAHLFVKMNTINWRQLKLQPFFDTAREPVLSELLVQIDQPNRAKDAENLKELNRLAKAKNITVTRFVRTACPANGTSILGANTDTLLNILLNLTIFAMGQAANPIAQTIKSLISAVVKQRNNPRVLPGLESMIKGSPLLEILNKSSAKVEGDLTILAGKTGGDRFLKIIKNFLVDQLFQAENDLVVDTESMFGGMARQTQVFYKYVTGNEVGHCSYFQNKTTQVAIYHALVSDKKTLNNHFKLFKRGGRNRAIIPRIPPFPPIPAEEKAPVKSQSLQVSIKNGHLKYAKFPVLIGHFKNDIITSAEGVMDGLLSYELSKNYEVGVYPGAVDSRPLILNNGRGNLSTMIVGLGFPEAFTPYQLSQSVEKGILAYLLDIDRNFGAKYKKEVGISTLLIGTNYINISVSDALNAILEGIVAANQKMLPAFGDTILPTIKKVEFIEIYEDKAIRAYHHLCDIAAGNNSYNISVRKKIIATNGRR
ncbi:MAG: hypothetical protein AAGJ18_11470, partial [Bacteroidota bacterium]